MIKGLIAQKPSIDFNWPWGFVGAVLSPSLHQAALRLPLPRKRRIKGRQALAFKLRGDTVIGSFYIFSVFFAGVVRMRALLHFGSILDPLIFGKAPILE